MSKKIIGQVKDFEVDWSSHLLTCCASHIEMCDDDAFVGMKIECEECGFIMKLTDRSSSYKWVRIK